MVAAITATGVAREPSRRRGAPWDEPPPCSGPRSLTGEGGAAPPLSDPASPPPNPPETSVRTVLPGLRFPRPQAHGAASPYARPTQPRGGVWPPPGQSASLAAATSRLHPTRSRCYPRGKRETPSATNRRAANGAIRPRGEKGDFWVGSPCGTLRTKGQPPPLKEQPSGRRRCGGDHPFLLSLPPSLFGPRGVAPAIQCRSSAPCTPIRTVSRAKLPRAPVPGIRAGPRGSSTALSWNLASGKGLADSHTGEGGPEQRPE
ncbi:hypothetical protein H8959_004023 [Pygathrix nigripes]